MPRRAIQARQAWEERFYTPTLDRLLSGLTREHAALVTHAHTSLLAAAPGAESIVWQGVPWRWTLVLQTKHLAKPWAYLIPQPGRPLVALPLEADLISSLPIRRLSKYVRSGLESAPQVIGICWCQWELATTSQTDELIALVQLRLKESLAPVA